MLVGVVMRAALQAMSMLFGGLGIFFLYHSFSSDPALSAYALILMGTASACLVPEPSPDPRTIEMFDLSADEAAFVIAVDILGILAAPRWAWR